MLKYEKAKAENEGLITKNTDDPKINENKRK